jgi:magnesium-transporting ATPase (P-type)
MKQWHTLSAQQVIKALGSHIEKGLSSKKVSERLSEYGLNSLPETKGQSPLKRFLLQFHNILIYVLIGSAFITALLGHYIDTGVILAVVIANAIIGYIQEGKAEKAMEAIKHMLAPHASVIRDGQRISVEGVDIVPGDIVLLEAGDKVPADLRLLKAHGLQIQEAILTGESLPVEKHTSKVLEDTTLGDRSCMAYSGTMVTNGQGTGVVVLTGKSTEIGRISGMISGVKTLTTPLINQMNIFARWLTVLILLVAGLLLVFGYFIAHYSFTEIFMAVVGLSIAAIPEGLPAVLTITLAVGVQAMAKRHAIVRRLPAIETLGAVSVICTDKTGTLTRNEMMVSSLAISDQIFTVKGDGYEPKGAIYLDDKKVSFSDQKVLSELGLASILCNEASLIKKDGLWGVEGGPMEGALLACAGKIGLDIEEEKASWKRIDAIPFDARHRYMATLNVDENETSIIFVKGAPEKIISMCKVQRESDGSEKALDKKYWNKTAEEIASRGQRVLAFAVKKTDKKQALDNKDVKDSLILVGLAGLIDPPRSETIEAVADCHRAGIRVKMITGDHAATAMAIAKQIGLENSDQVLTGSDLDKMDDAELALAVLETDIYARTSPEDKLRLVMALQSHGITVAMTGDGVNDAPALKRADAGIAMGQKGSEAAKEAAELVLVDDNFASIVAAVREGRTVYDNIKKVISWTLPTSTGEAMVIVVALLFGMALPVTPVQILWINLITVSTLGIALAFEPTEVNTMRRPPRARDAPILNGELIWQIVFISALFLCFVFGVYSYAIDNGYPIELARTLAVNTLVILEIFSLFFIRNIYGTSLTLQAVKGTKVIWTTVVILVIAQFLITYLPLLQKIFETSAVSIIDGLILIGIGITFFAILETEKQIRISFKRKN